MKHGAYCPVRAAAVPRTLSKGITIMAAGGWTDKRPKSPHVQVWRWHVTMATSIFHRASGVALYVGSLLLVGWLAAAAAGPDVYAAYEGFLLSGFGRFLLFSFTLAITYHLANGVRHLFWDAGKGYDKKVSDMTSWAIIAFTPIATLIIWGAAYALHAGH